MRPSQLTNPLSRSPRQILERVTLRGNRPPVPPGMPPPYALLMTRCWQADPAGRPAFGTILDTIDLMIEDHGGPWGPTAVSSGHLGQTRSGRNGAARSGVSDGSGRGDSGGAAVGAAASGGGAGNGGGGEQACVVDVPMPRHLAPSPYLDGF